MGGFLLWCYSICLQFIQQHMGMDSSDIRLNNSCFQLQSIKFKDLGQVPSLKRLSICGFFGGGSLGIKSRGSIPPKDITTFYFLRQDLPKMLRQAFNLQSYCLSLWSHWYYSHVPPRSCFWLQQFYRVTQHGLPDADEVVHQYIIYSRLHAEFPQPYIYRLGS